MLFGQFCGRLCAVRAIFSIHREVSSCLVLCFSTSEFAVASDGLDCFFIFVCTFKVYKPPPRLTIEKKAAIIGQVQSGRLQAEMGREFGASKKTVSDFMKRKMKILEVATRSSGAGKNTSQGFYRKLKEVLLVWLNAMIP